MADYVVLGGNERKTEYRLVVHIQTPTGNNDAAKPWSECVQEYAEYQTGLIGTEATRSIWPGLGATRQASLDAGTHYEFSKTVSNIDAHATTAIKKTFMDAFVVGEAAAETTRLSAVLQFWGHTEMDVT